jgi:lysophospholipase L1-like esterase
MFSGEVLLLWVLLAVGAVADENKRPADPDPNRFAAEIQAFAQWDSRNAVPADPVLFVGSSSIRLWRTHESFPGLPVVNRGFGGSQVCDVLYFADRIVFPYKPSVIVFYAGDNDLAAGKSAQRVFDDWRRFIGLVHARQPATRIVLVGIKPSRARWSLWPEAQKANALLADFCKSDNRLLFADLGTPLLGPDGRPAADLFLKDQLHLNDRGYALWSKALAPVLQKIFLSSVSRKAE